MTDERVWSPANFSKVVAYRRSCLTRPYLRLHEDIVTVASGLRILEPFRGVWGGPRGVAGRVGIVERCFCWPRRRPIRNRAIRPWRRAHDRISMSLAKRYCPWGRSTAGTAWTERVGSTHLHTARGFELGRVRSFRGERFDRVGRGASGRAPVLSPQPQDRGLQRRRWARHPRDRRRRTSRPRCAEEEGGGSTPNPIRRDRHPPQGPAHARTRPAFRPGALGDGLLHCHRVKRSRALYGRLAARSGSPTERPRWTCCGGARSNTAATKKRQICD